MMIDRIENALSMLRTDLVQRFSQGDWNEDQAEQAARTVLAYLRPEPSAPLGNMQARNPKLPGELLRRTVRYINDNLDSKLTWREIAARIGVDAFGFGRSFKRSTGITPHQYVIRCRVRRAMRLLSREELSVADIALEVGCTCQSHLTTLFRKYTGTTPGAFRRAARDSRTLLGAAAANRPSPRPPEPHRTNRVRLMLGTYHGVRIEHADAQM